MAPVPIPAKSPNNGKRKRPQQQQQEPSRKRGRGSIHDARAISAQTSGKAFGNGEIDVDKFVKAREFEISALEQGMKNARNVLSRRAFQSVPRELRRRTASHNVKKVPKRLRNRAAREMAEDNTPTVTSRRRKPKPKLRLRIDIARRLKELNTRKKAKTNGEEQDNPPNAPSVLEKEGPTTASDAATARSAVVVAREPRIKKNTLQKPEKPKSKFRKRQIHKTWLPTHLFHTKRAHMTPPKEPLWRMSIPLSPTVKNYRPTHRATTLRGAMAWDMSYMSTIGLTGPEKSIIGLLKALGVGKEEADGFWEKRAARWVRGSRSWHGLLYEREGWSTGIIAPATVIWCADRVEPNNGKMEIDGIEKKRTKPTTRQALIRVHPAAFLELWEELLRVSKVQKPTVLLEDLRFEVGSIEVSGPASTEALSGVLWPCDPGEDEAHKGSSEIWLTMRNVASPSNLPANAMLALEVTDPRLHQGVKVESAPLDQGSQMELLQTLSAWPPDKSTTPAAIFSRSERLAASRQLLSQKAINRRKSLKDPGQLVQPLATDPKIPVLLLAMGGRGHGAGSGSWTLLLPWKCVLPVWYCLMYYPLSTGGTIRFGGLDQIRQTAFEAGVPWFPADHPGTKAGRKWEQQERSKREASWKKRPKGKRTEYDTCKIGTNRIGEIGRGWACDWEKLMPQNADMPEDDDTKEDQRVLRCIPKRIANSLLRTVATDLGTTAPDRGVDSTSQTEGLGLVTVKVTFTGRGVPTACARIYRLPIDDNQLREQWLAVLTQSNAKEERRIDAKPTKNSSAHVQRQHLAAGLLQPRSVSDEKDNAMPEVPAEQDLMGFITTGNFNLHEGRGTGLGCILLKKALEYKIWKAKHYPDAPRTDEQMCIVREAGQALGRLARWETV